MTAPRQTRSLLPVLMACAMGTGFTATVAKAETPLGVTSMAEAKANYQHDVSACKSHAVDEDTKTCLLEAKRAYDEARREASHSGGKSTRVAKKTTASKSTTSTSGTAASTDTKAESTDTKAKATDKSQATPGKTQ